MLAVANGDRARSDGSGHLDRHLHRLRRGDVSEIVAAIEYGDGRRAVHDLRLSARVDIAVVHRHQVAWSGAAAMRLDAAQVGFDLAGSSHVGFRLEHALLDIEGHQQPL